MNLNFMFIFIPGFGVVYALWFGSEISSREVLVVR